MIRSRALLGVLAILVSTTTLSACSGTRNADCGYTGEPGSAQYERDIDRAAKNGCDSDEIVPYQG